MFKFIVNKNAQATGEHEVHDLSRNCRHLPLISNQVDLGLHFNCQSAISAAKKHFYIVDGCAYCIPTCHRR